MFRLTRIIVVLLITIFALTFAILRTPAVQNKVANTITNVLSNKLNTKVSLDNVSIEFFDKIVLENFYLEDIHGDTLLYSKKLKANVRTDLLALLRRSIIIDEITLNNAEVNLHRDSGEVKNNLGSLLEKFSDPNAQKEVKKQDDEAPFGFGIKAIYLNDVHFKNSSAYSGEDLDVYSGNIAIKINKINLPEDCIDIKSISILNPKVNLFQYNWLEEILPEDDEPSPLVITVEQLNLGAGQFKVDNIRNSPGKLTDDFTLDLEHLDLFDINIDINNFRYVNWQFSGEIESISAKDKSGFSLEKLAVRDALVTEKLVQLNDLRLDTPKSQLGDTVIFKYRQFPDWREFPNKVYMDLRFHNQSKVRLGDIMSFAHVLEDNAFFTRNRDEVISISGRVFGKVSTLKARDLNLKIGKDTYLKGEFNTRNLNVKDEQFVFLRLDRLKTTMTTLRQIIPKFNLPINFDKLGKLDFKGEFNGFFTDFVAFGNVKTDLGLGKLDMRMNTKSGRTKATYSGNIALEDFDLATWTDNPDFGKVTFYSKVSNGIGLTGATAQADLTAEVKNFTFKGYSYDNLNLSGNLKDRFFNGDLNIKDENLAFSFNGKIDFTRPKPLFDFNADIAKIAFQPLKLSDKDLVLSGKINELNIKDIKISDIKGKTSISNFQIIENGRDTFALDTISIISEILPDSTKHFFVNSDIINAEMNGFFDLSRIPQTFIHFIHKNFNPLAQRLNLPLDTTKYIAPQQYDFNVNIIDSKKFNRLIHEDLGTFKDIQIKGYLDNVRDSLDWDISIPTFQFRNIKAENINTYGETIGSEGNLNFEVFDTQIGEKLHIPPLKILSLAKKDTMDFALNLISNSELLDNLNIDGQIYPYEDQTEITLNNSALVFLSDIWTINPGNYIRIGSGNVEAKNFKLTSEGREITLNTEGEKGLILNANSFDLSFINEIWKEERFMLSGPFRLNVKANDVFKLEGLHALVVADTFRINGDDWGMLRVDADAKSIKNKVDIVLNMVDDSDGQQLQVEGYYNPPSIAVPEGKIPLFNKAPNYLNLDFQVSYFPINFLGYLIQEGISNPVGYLDASFKMHGNVKKLILDGEAKVHDLGVTVDYLNTRYYANNQKLKLKENTIDATGGFITDEQGNKAYITGGLVHDYLRDWGPSLTVRSDRFLMLNTTKENNSLYYGTGIGSGVIHFNGLFRRVDIDIFARTGQGTEVSIPVETGQDAQEVSFIKFKKKKIYIKDKNKKKEEKELNPFGNEELGVDVKMSLELTPEAQMRLIFDESAGDVLQGRGNGNIRIAVPRSRQEFLMYGNYEIESGDYLFTMQNIVNKPFEVKRGGTIVWSGDPFGAKINLVAEYKNLNVAPYNFIQEYVEGASPEVRTLARQATQVDLQMNLKGELLKPEISFDLGFPNLRGEIKTFTDSKMRVIKRDPNELNRQVFGLVVAGQFLPASTSLQSEGLAIGINTLTEMLSQQLSIYLTDLVTGWLKEDGLISGIDFDVAYNRYQNTDLDDVSRANNELQGRLKTYLFNERVAVYGGVNIDLDNNVSSANPQSSGAFYAGDFAIEYFLTDDKQFKIKFYQSIQPDIAGGRRNRTGVGLSYRKEFDNFQDFLKGLKSSTKDIKKQEK